ncbi:MAG: peptidase T, partial [Clostridiales bacterium]|nr:peptidase T [Clostridiales bacterium]
MDHQEETVSRFLRYIAVDTQSSEISGTHPSTAGQFALARLLAEELRGMGIPAEDIHEDTQHCYVYCIIKGDPDLPRIGFISHMDTSPEASGRDVKPNIVRDYDGGDIELGYGKVLSPSDFPELLMYKGQTVITASGDTLLGSDDKSGIAEIMTMASYYVSHPEIKRGDICIAFTPDEEIGEGTEFFDINRFGADFAYTVDGGVLGELSYENFNAATASVTVNGRTVHPGEAYGKMINSQRLALKIDSMIPDEERPETTRDREG